MDTQRAPDEKLAARTAARRKWREKNLEADKAQRKARYHAQREQERAYQRAYYATNGARIRAQVRARQLERHDEMRAYQAAWRREDRLKRRALYLWTSAQNRASRRGLEFTISRDDIQIPDVCPVLGIPLVVTTGKRQPGSPSLDRIDNSRGYVPGNIRVISAQANTWKSDMTLADAERLVANWSAR